MRISITRAFTLLLLQQNSLPSCPRLRLRGEPQPIACETEEALGSFVAEPIKVEPLRPLTTKTSHNTVIEQARLLEAEANRWGIFNVFEDSGYKTLVLVMMFGLRILPGRQGDDAYDPETNRCFELKTLNLLDSFGRPRKLPWGCPQNTH